MVANRGDPAPIRFLARKSAGWNAEAFACLLAPTDNPNRYEPCLPLYSSGILPEGATVMGL